MRALFAFLVLVYLIGIGVMLAPTISEKWGTATASDFFASTMREFPKAAAWPALVYQRVRNNSEAA